MASITVHLVWLCSSLLYLSKFLFLNQKTNLVHTFSVARPIIIGQLVFFFTPGQQSLSRTDALLYTIFLLALQIIDVICRQNYIFLIENLIIKIRTAFCSLIYRKILKLPVSRLRYISFGNVANLITRDIGAFDQFFLNFTYAWSGFIVTVISCYNIYRRIGWPVVVVIFSFAVFIPLQGTYDLM